MTDTTVQLGDIVFQGFEVPEKIGFGGEQMLAVHKMVGGRRIVDAMGRDDRPLEWSGRFRGPDALARATALDGMRAGGLEWVLTWSELAYRVVIQRFEVDFERFYELPYTISCTVIEDMAAPNPTGAVLTADDMVRDDARTATGLGSLIGDAPLSGLLGTLSDAVGAVPSFAAASQGVLNTVLGPLADVRGRVGDLIATVGAPLEGLTSILPSGPVASLASSLVSQVSGFTQLADLEDLSSVTGRMATNLLNVSSSGAKIVQAGGDLYTLAAVAYGDASAWDVIARANGLADPILEGLNTLLIPRTARG